MRFGSNWVCIHCRKLANLHVHHWRSVSIQTKSIKDSITKQHTAPRELIAQRNNLGGDLVFFLPLCRREKRLEIKAEST